MKAKQVRNTACHFDPCIDLIVTSLPPALQLPTSPQENARSGVEDKMSLITFSDNAEIKFQDFGEQIWSS